MKKIIVCLICLSLLAFTAGCDSEDKKENDSESEALSENAAENTEEGECIVDGIKILPPIVETLLEEPDGDVVLN